MPESWYLMSQPLFNSGFEGDEFSTFAQGGFEEILDSPLADEIEIYEKTLSATPVSARAIIQGVTADNYNNSVLRQFLCKIGTLRSGQYIKARGQMWLVYSLPDNNKMYEKAIAWQCKYSIKFVSPTSGEIVEYPVYDINSTQYGSGETSEDHLTLGTSQHLIYIPYNEETIKLDSGFRFLIDKNRDNPTAYRLAQVDPGGYSCGKDDGLIQWTIVESQFDEKTDSKELMVADYFGKSELSKPEQPSEIGYSIRVNPDGGDASIIFGETLKSSVIICKDGVAQSGLPFDVTITDGAEFGTIQSVDQNGFVLYALNNRDFIGQEITVEITSSECEASSKTVFTVRGWY